MLAAVSVEEGSPIPETSSVALIVPRAAAVPFSYGSESSVGTTPSVSAVVAAHDAGEVTVDSRMRSLTSSAPLMASAADHDWAVGCELVADLASSSALTLTE